MFPIPFPKTLLLLGAGVLGVIYLAGNHAGSSPHQVEPCAFHVTADVLNVRSGPAVGERRVDSLERGEQVTATPNVVGGFRDLGGGRWVAHEFLTPVPESPCRP